MPLKHNVIVTRKGQRILVDPCDKEWLGVYSWRIKTTTRGYRYVVGGFNYSMARMIMAAKDGEMIDHINGNTLDNRRANLRVCNKFGNARNKRGWSACGKKGVTWSRACDKWQAQIKHLGKTYHLGVFTYLRDAADAYDKAAIQLYGEFAWTNS